MNFTKTLTKKILIITILAAFAATAALAQQTDKILVTGAYPLKQSDINRVTEIYEWMLAGKFTAAQRKRYQTLIVKDAQTNQESAKSIMSMLESYKRIQAADPAKREDARQKLTPTIVAALEAEESELNTLLLEMHRNGRNSAAATEDTDAPSDDPSPEDSIETGKTGSSGGAVKISDLAGVWSTSSVSGERYRSLVTGELSDPSGSIIEYQISPNGEIKYAGYLSTTVYSCTTKLFVHKSGRISISGSNITFSYSPGKRMYQTCSASASSNSTIPAEKKTYPFRLERDEYGLKLCTTEEAGNDFCIRKRS